MGGLKYNSFESYIWEVSCDVIVGYGRGRKSEGNNWVLPISSSTVTIFC